MISLCLVLQEGGPWGGSVGGPWTAGRGGTQLSLLYQDNGFIYGQLTEVPFY
jgi:hypothetical protein